MYVYRFLAKFGSESGRMRVLCNVMDHFPVSSLVITTEGEYTLHLESEIPKPDLEDFEMFLVKTEN